MYTSKVHFICAAAVDPVRFPWNAPPERRPRRELGYLRQYRPGDVNISQNDLDAVGAMHFKESL
jgi:hypothetical protein